jgi:hypothetical protein
MYWPLMLSVAGVVRAPGLEWEQPPNKNATNNEADQIVKCFFIQLL